MSSKRAFYATPDVKPKPVPLNACGIPPELRAAPRWVPWSFVWKGGKWTKAPLSAKTGRVADCNNPSNWGAFDQCSDMVGAGKADGIGFALTGSGYVGFDLDDHRCPVVGDLSEFAERVLRVFPTYCEVSASATGVKLIGKGAFPEGTPKKVAALGIELFDRGFFCITGNAVPGAPPSVTDLQPAIDAHLADILTRDGTDRHTQKEAAGHKRTQLDTTEHRTAEPSDPAPADGRAAELPRSGSCSVVPSVEDVEARVRSHSDGAALMGGDTSGHHDDHSGADLALCNLVAFYSAGRADLIDAVFRRSGLMRDKWDAKHARDGRTYGEMTVAKALADKHDIFDWSHPPMVTFGPGGAPGPTPPHAAPLPEREWPTLASEAYQGLPGEFVAMIREQTESDPVALLFQFLVAFGSAVGRGPYRQVEFTRHGANENLVIAGQSAKGRKGTSWNWVHGVFRLAAPEWATGRQLSGVGSGEGVIYNVRDPSFKNNEDGERVRADDGIEDKRLLIHESEFASILRVIERPATTTSALLRAAWDGGTLRNAVKNSPLVATDPHVSIIGHITTDELVRLLTASEVANGFGNRHLFALVRRSKLLPFGGTVEMDVLRAFAERVSERLASARGAEELRYDAAAASLWAERYAHLSRDRYGLAGSLCNRAEAHVTRLALIYALADGAAEVRAEHLRAAFAAWEFSEASVRYIFGDATGDPLADQIRGFLRAAPGGLTRTEISAALGRNVVSAMIARALDVLLRAGIARVGERKDTGGKPAEVWIANS